MWPVRAVMFCLAAQPGLSEKQLETYCIAVCTALGGDPVGGPQHSFIRFSAPFLINHLFSEYLSQTQALAERYEL